MLSPLTHVTPHPQVVATAVRREIVLLSMATSDYYTLNESGAHIWRDLQEGFSLLEISHRLVDQYDVSPARAQQSLLNLIRMLAAEQLVLVKDNTEEESN
jgi:hypothetical protein